MRLLFYIHNTKKVSHFWKHSSSLCTWINCLFLKYWNSIQLPFNWNLINLIRQMFPKYKWRRKKTFHGYYCKLFEQWCKLISSCNFYFSMNGLYEEAFYFEWDSLKWDFQNLKVFCIFFPRSLNYFWVSIHSHTISGSIRPGNSRPDVDDRFYL